MAVQGEIYVWSKHPFPGFLKNNRNAKLFWQFTGLALVRGKLLVFNWSICGSQHLNSIQKTIIPWAYFWVVKGCQHTIRVLPARVLTVFSCFPCLGKVIFPAPSSFLFDAWTFRVKIIWLSQVQQSFSHWIFIRKSPKIM